MTSPQKTDLVDLLAQSFSATQTLLNEIDLEMVVYENPPWQVRDILWHIAVWDRQVTKSIQAFLAGSEYAIPEFEEDQFNNAAFQDGRDLSPEQLLNEFDRARSEFQQAVERVPDDHFRTEFLYPWGDESGDVAQVVKEMVEHDEEHRSEIIAAANR
jgi:hypothetical protein